jgi:hypothetical protein
MNHRTNQPSRAHRAGLSIVELLLALALSAVRLTALAVALNASFHAYATAAESASMQSSSRMVMQRLLGMIRNGTLHDAYDPNDSSKTLAPPSAAPVRSVGIQMIDPHDQLLRVWWKANSDYPEDDLGDLLYAVDGQNPQPLLNRVRAAQTDSGEPYLFTLASRSSEDGLLLKRATIDLAVEPGADATLALESARGASDTIRLVGSAMPRRNLDRR